MFKRFANLFKQDITVALRNYYHFVILILVTLMIIFINFVVPKQVKLTPSELIFDKTEGKAVEAFLLQDGIDKSRLFNSREALMERVRSDNNSLGIIIEGDLENAKVTVIHQGTEATEIINVLDATIEGTLDEIRGTVRTTNNHVEYLRPQTNPIPFNKNLVPIMIVTEAVMLGFLLIAVMVFQEKEEGSIRAYRVSPARTLEYILSKTAVNIILSLIYTGLLVVFTIGFQVNYPLLFLLIILASFFVTIFGLAVSVFFRNLQEFLFVGVFIMAIFGLPLGTYLSPSFAPSFITWIPSYSVLFGIREILFPTGKGDFLVSLNLTLAAEGILFLLISYWAVNRKLMKEGK